MKVTKLTSLLICVLSTSAWGQLLELNDSGFVEYNGCAKWETTRPPETIAFKWTGRCGQSPDIPAVRNAMLGAGEVWAVKTRPANIYIDYYRRGDDEKNVEWYRIVSAAAPRTVPSADSFNRCFVGRREGGAIMFGGAGCSELPPHVVSQARSLYASGWQNRVAVLFGQQPVSASAEANAAGNRQVQAPSPSARSNGAREGNGKVRTKSSNCIEIVSGAAVPGINVSHQDWVHNKCDFDIRAVVICGIGSNGKFPYGNQCAEGKWGMVGVRPKGYTWLADAVLTYRAPLYQFAHCDNGQDPTNIRVTATEITGDCPQ